MSAYPPLVPPVTLGSLGLRPKHEWTSAEAKAFAVWLIQESAFRVRTLLSFVGVEPTDVSLNALVRIEKQAATMLRMPPFREEDESSTEALTHIGRSFAIDVGLFVGNLAILTRPSLSWSPSKERGRHYVARGLPVLVGFESRTEVSPITGILGSSSYIASRPSAKLEYVAMFRSIIDTD